MNSSNFFACILLLLIYYWAAPFYNTFGQICSRIKHNQSAQYNVYLSPLIFSFPSLAFPSHKSFSQALTDCCQFPPHFKFNKKTNLGSICLSFINACFWIMQGEQLLQVLHNTLAQLITLSACKSVSKLAWQAQFLWYLS